MAKRDYDYLFKLVLIGDSGVGKSCLLLRFAVRSRPAPRTARQALAHRAAGDAWWLACCDGTVPHIRPPGAQGGGWM